MPTINSSPIAWIDYDPISCTLSVTFQSGRTYNLRRVPERHFHGLLRTTSPGWYFNTYLLGDY
jgi:hypothetical protein